MIDVLKINELISSSKIEELANYIKQNDLQIVDGKIVASKDQISYATQYWDKKQQVKKLNLNSLYGAILNPYCKFFDKRIGQSTTLSGRSITRHMNSFINECVTGVYDYAGEAIIYSDSVTGDTLIKTDSGEVTIEELFRQTPEHSMIGEKEYATWSSAKVIGFNAYEDATVMSKISYIMRHKTKKKLYKITLENGKSVKVTEDHSIMVDRDGMLIEVKPTDILNTDLIICLATHQ